jgi:two-component system OmpR family sensor kinase/two-component system phosphate regulon sensor histidine kinase PhoR
MFKLNKVSRYRRRLFYNFFFLFVAFAIAIGVFQYQREKFYRINQLENTLITYAQLVNRYVDENNMHQANSFANLNKFMRTFPQTELRVTLIDDQGLVLFDSFVADYEALENHLHRPEVQQALHEAFGKSIRFSTSTQRDYYYCAIHFNGYFVRAALPYNIQVENYLKVDTFFIYVILFLFVVFAGLLIYLSDRFGKSISTLHNFVTLAADGKNVDFPVEFPDNELGIIGKQIVDVYSRLQKTKRELSAEREKLFRHLQISHEGIAVFTKKKKQLLANNHFIQYLNTLSDVSAVTPNKFFEIKELNPINDFINENLNNDKEHIVSELSSNILTVHKSGKYYVIQAIVFKDRSFEISINDVTKLEKEKKLKQQMTSNIAHELKTPVSSILGYLETMLNTEMTEKQRTFFMERAYIQSQRLSSLIQDISLLNKIEEAADLFEIETLNVKEIVSMVIDDLRLKIEEKNISVRMEFPDNLTISGNRSVFFSIWRNLVENSINYAGEGVTISMKNYLQDDKFLYFSFSDTGTGIPDKHLSRIFERFYRVDSGRSRSMGGTGLGLAIVKNGVLFHKGEISAKNLKKGGVEFVFTICKQM